MASKKDKVKEKVSDGKKENKMRAGPACGQLGLVLSRVKAPAGSTATPVSRDNLLEQLPAEMRWLRLPSDLACWITPQSYLQQIAREKLKVRLPQRTVSTSSE